MDQISASGRVLTLVHFAFLRGQMNALPENAGEQSWRLACMPNMQELGQTLYHPNYQHTNEPRAVTCPACKASDVYKRAMEPYR